MPIVKCYEHPRFKRKYYPIDAKSQYIEDLKHEAFEIMKVKWFERKFSILQSVIGNDFRSMHDVVDWMNYFREETMKSFCWDVIFGEYDKMRLHRQFYRPIVVSDHVHSVCYYPGESKTNSCVIEINVIDWGYLGALRQIGDGKFISTMFGLNHDSEMDIQFEDNRICFYTAQPDLVHRSRMFVDQANSYRFINGAQTRILTLGSNDINDYFGKIRLY